MTAALCKHVLTLNEWPYTVMNTSIRSVTSYQQVPKNVVRQSQMCLPSVNLHSISDSDIVYERTQQISL
jgi:hypothetical protein